MKTLSLIDHAHRHSYTPPGTFVAGFHFTIALLPGGPLLLTHPPVWYKPELVKTEKELEDPDLAFYFAVPGKNASAINHWYARLKNFMVPSSAK